MSDIVIGIDLGTTNSCAAYYLNGRVRIFKNKEGDRITSSFVFFTKEEPGVLVGKFGKHMSDQFPENGISEIKRFVGRKFDDPYLQNSLNYLPNKVYRDFNNNPLIEIECQNEIQRKTPEEICTLILSKIKADVESIVGHSLDKAVITVPAYFNVNQREVTLAAAREAGFTVLKLFNEPTAAALTYFLENDHNNKDYSLVYDLGGGTFDVAILKKDAKNIDIVAVDGNTHLGGRDFDNLIINYVCEYLLKNYNYNVKSYKRKMRRLQRDSEETKKTLSVAQSTNIILEGFVEDQKCVVIPFTRMQFEEMGAELFRKTIDIVDSCLRNSNIPKEEIKNVILSGGSTRIPKIQELLSTYFNGMDLNKSIDPDECVAEGAAIQAAMLSKNPKQEIIKLQINDVIPLSLGCSGTVGDMEFMIKRNSPIPTSVSSKYSNLHNKQKNMLFKIYEGERQIVNKNLYLGEMTIDNLTPAPPRQCEVIFTMSVDENGILSVTAEEIYKKNVRKLNVCYTRGYRSDSQVQNAVKDAQDHKEEDERFIKLVSLKQRLLDYCIVATYNFEDQQLTNKYNEVYKFCSSTFKKIKTDLNIDNEDYLKKLMEKTKFLCKPIAEKENFKYMPDI
ncbi:HSP70 and/or MreB Mbl domain containing protein [Asbolus verrucosus]|uniref:HSP70 and/or MreB Mbl domain containing protein n=1 Tax=Asbolus verrucosus TaxID=1661398 RepID=A0A482VF87_ASBVE|nr:HSP70 and/or MreB Mbl domain containing protein [Asbolus verrucosus]